MRVEKNLAANTTGDRTQGFWALAQRIAQSGTRGEGRLAFLREVSVELLAFTGCGIADWWMTEGDDAYHWRMNAPDRSRADAEPASEYDHIHCPLANGRPGPSLCDQAKRLMMQLTNGGSTIAAGRRVFAVRDAATRRRLIEATPRDGAFARLHDANESTCVLLLHLSGDGPFAGMLALTAPGALPLDGADEDLYEQLAETIWRAVANRRAQFRLRERIKELTCLHRVAQIIQLEGDARDTALQAIVDLLPQAMQFPEIAGASLSIDDRRFATEDIAARMDRLAVPVMVNDRRRGLLEVAYRTSHPEFAAGAFLREENELLSSVAHEIAMLVERAESDTAKASLAEQLRHADRLATIGQLAAGVAHELNEPLGSIMGFAQLLQKHPGLAEEAHRDAEQIVQAVLHGREIVKKLLLFSRQSSSQRVQLDLSALIRDSLYFLEARCRSNGIDLQMDLANEPLWITACPSEITQVAVNLAVNAIQAMPGGGVLIIGTRAAGESVVLSVKDNGAGMDEATQLRLFTPFFTTKDVGEGTGLGLSVVLGIVTAHGGTIHVESASGRGSEFAVSLPVAVSSTGSNTV